MTGFESLTQHDLKTSDVAVSGLIGGLTGGVAMLAFLVLAGLAQEVTPAQTLARFAPGQGDNPLTGSLAHLAVSGMYGLVYGLLWHVATSRLKTGRARGLSLLAGAGYGVLLWLAAQAVVLPTSAPALQAYPSEQFLVAHLVFGMALGWMVRPVRAVHKSGRG